MRNAFRSISIWWFDTRWFVLVHLHFSLSLSHSFFLKDSLSIGKFSSIYSPATFGKTSSPSETLTCNLHNENNKQEIFIDFTLNRWLNDYKPEIVQFPSNIKLNFFFCFSLLSNTEQKGNVPNWLYCVRCVLIGDRWSVIVDHWALCVHLAHMSCELCVFIFITQLIFRNQQETKNCTSKADEIRSGNNFS